MTKKPRQNYLSKVFIKQDGKYDFKRSKPWNKREQTDKVDMFANVTMSDLQHGMSNRGNSKRFARHKLRQRME